MTELRYDPARLPLLRASATRAAQHLLDLRSADHAAASALRVAAVVRSGLEQDWLAAVDRLLASDAMLAWATTGPVSLGGMTGSRLGNELADRAEALAMDWRPELAVELAAGVRAALDDDAAMAALFAALGPATLLELLTTFAAIDTGSIEVPDALRDAIVATASAGGLADDFAPRLVAATVDEQARLGGRGDAGLALSFLLHGDGLPTDFLVAATAEMIDQERAHARTNDLAAADGWTLWLAHGWVQARGFYVDFAPPGAGGLDWAAAQDPMYALLGQLARNGRAGREVFTDRDRAAYLFGERHVLGDGGVAIVTAASTAAAGPDVVPTAPKTVLDDASFVASAFVNHFGATGAAAVDGEDEAAVAAAHIVGTHLYGVDYALAWGDGRDHEAGPPEIGVDELGNQVFGDEVRTTALFDAAALGPVLDLAARTDAGTAVLRADLAAYQQGVATIATERVATGEVATGDATTYLQEAMQDAARLEGRFLEHVGHEAERRGRDTDRVRSLWISLLGQGVERGAELFGPAGSAVVKTVVDPAEQLARDQLVDAVEDAQDDGERSATLASEQLAYVWLRELQGSGVITTSLPANLLDDGRLPTYAQLASRLEADGPDDPSSAWTVGTVLQALDDASRASVDIDGRAMVDAMKVVQLEHYRVLED